MDTPLSDLGGAATFHSDNLAHPARYIQDHTGRRVTNRYLQRQFEIVLACRDWLAAHNNRELLKAIEEEEKKTVALTP